MPLDGEDGLRREQVGAPSRFCTWLTPDLHLIYTGGRHLEPQPVLLDGEDGLRREQVGARRVEQHPHRREVHLRPPPPDLHP